MRSQTAGRREGQDLAHLSDGEAGFLELGDEGGGFVGDIRRGRDEGLDLGVFAGVSESQEGLDGFEAALRLSCLLDSESSAYRS